MIKRLIFCLLIHSATHAMQSAEPVAGAEMVMAQLLDTKKTEDDVMRFLESFEDFNARVDVNELLVRPPIADVVMAELGPCILQRMPEELSLLHVAVSHKLCRVIIFLLEHNANVNIRDNCGFTPLGFAIVYKPNISIIRTLLDYGASQQSAYRMPNIAKSWELNALGLAVSRGRATIITLLLAHGANPNEETDAEGLPALAYTTYPWPQPERYQCTQLLLQAGANPAWQSKDGCTVLTISAQNSFMYPSMAGVCPAILNTRHKSRYQVLAERAHEDVGIPATQLTLQVTVSPSTRHALISRLRHSRNFLLSLKTDDGAPPLTEALNREALDNVIEIVKCLTYAEIKEAIATAKQMARYYILLQALAAPENCASVMHEARNDGNQELISDLENFLMARRDQ